VFIKFHAKVIQSHLFSSPIWIGRGHQDFHGAGLATCFRIKVFSPKTVGPMVFSWCSLGILGAWRKKPIKYTHGKKSSEKMIPGFPITVRGSHLEIGVMFPAY